MLCIQRVIARSTVHADCMCYVINFGLPRSSREREGGEGKRALVIRCPKLSPDWTSSHNYRHLQTIALVSHCETIAQDRSSLIGTTSLQGNQYYFLAGRCPSFWLFIGQASPRLSTLRQSLFFNSFLLSSFSERWHRDHIVTWTIDETLLNDIFNRYIKITANKLQYVSG